LTNIVEQDHHFIGRGRRAMQCLRSFQSRERTRAGVEAIDLIRKGQVKRLDGSDGVGQERFVESLFQLAGSRKPVSGLTCLKIFLATLPRIGFNGIYPGLKPVKLRERGLKKSSRASLRFLRVMSLIGKDRMQTPSSTTTWRLMSNHTLSLFV
jgi:hypothetical protein